jgi:hypothetical protein
MHAWTGSTMLLIQECDERKNGFVHKNLKSSIDRKFLRRQSSRTYQAQEHAEMFTTDSKNS